MSVEEQIKKAMAEGAFDNLAGKGKPLDLEGYFQTPEHLRMCYSILKNGDFVPEEVQTLKEIEALKEQLSACSDEIQRKQIAKTINEKMLSVTSAMERYKRNK
jgi:DnaJ-domain-containing protein 1